MRNKRKRRSKYLPSNRTLGFLAVVLVAFFAGRWTYQTGLLRFDPEPLRPGSPVSGDDFLISDGEDTGDLREILAGKWIVRGVENSQTLLVGDTLEFSGDTLLVVRPGRSDRRIKYDLVSDIDPSGMYWLETSGEGYAGQDLLYSLFNDHLLLTIPFDGKRPPHHGADRKARTEMALLSRVDAAEY